MALSGRPFGGAFKLLMVAAMVAGLLMFAPSARSQGDPAVSCRPSGQGLLCLQKTVSPDPSTVGQQLTFTITFTNTQGSGIIFGPGGIQDLLPPGVRFDNATIVITNGTQGTCAFDPTLNIVFCGNAVLPNNNAAIVNVFVTPTQCGSFTNTATDDGVGDTVQVPFTVCPTPGQPPPQQQQPPPQQQNQQQPPSQQQPTCPPAALESGIEPQSGNVSLSSGTENSGDYAHQVTPTAQNGDTGNMVNSPSVLQTCGSTSGAIEPGGISKEISPVVDVSSPSTIDQSSSS